MATILVLDDDQVILDLLRIVLRDAGYDIVIASGLQAIPPDTRADIVITDLALGAYHRESALDWIGSLRTRFGDAPLLVVTAHADAVAEPDMLGANAIIAKPFDVEALLAKLDELLA